MKQSIRFFSIGLLTSTILLFGYYFFFDQSEELEAIPVDQLISHIESDGYRVITEDEFIAFSLLNEEKAEEEANQEPKEKEKPDEKKEKKDEDVNDEKEDVKKITFTTKAGVVSQDIAEILVENEIIEDRQKFVDYLEDNDYSPYIQLGKFEVSSDMSFKELAETITTYPGN